MEFHKCDICNRKGYVAENIDMQIIVIERYKKDENLFYGGGAVKIRRHLENVKIDICDNCLIKRLEGNSVLKEGRNLFFINNKVDKH